MSLEDRLRQHLDTEARRVPEPPDGLAAVRRRGRRRRVAERAGVVTALLLMAVAVPVGWQAFEDPAIRLGPGETPTPTPVTTAPTPADPGHPGPPTPADEATPVALSPTKLGAPVLAWGPGAGDRLERIDAEGRTVLWDGPVAAALPDGRGGVVLQPAGRAAVRWLPDGDAAAEVPLAEADVLTLRGLLPDGRVLYSLRSGDRQEDTESFFAVALAEGAQPELLATTSAHESWRVGPAFAVDDRPIVAACHLHCSLWADLAEAPPEAEPLYRGLAIEGLTATPDGAVLAFVEHDPVLAQDPGGPPPELVLLDGASFAELARVALPWQAGAPVGAPVVALSAHGHRVLVSLGTDVPSTSAVAPTTPFLVEDVLTEAPRVIPVDFTGALRWTNP
jgi:hypothetical protein